MEQLRMDFRIKVDLSKVFQDHRKISWIYVNTSMILTIKHLQEHIAKLFDILEPFYCICESTYLPLNEDVRILRNDNFVTLIPGTLTGKSTNSIREWSRHSFKETVSQVSSVQADTCEEKDVHTNGDDQAKSQSSQSGDGTTQISFDTIPEPTTANTTIYHSMLEESEINSATESRVTDSLMTEDYTVDLNNSTKRKRIRRKRGKRLNRDSETSIKQNTYVEGSKKPRIIDSIIIASGKHIRFSGADEEIDLQCRSPPVKSEFYTKICDTPDQNKLPSKDLNCLLALKQCSTPLTFECKKVEKELKINKSSKSLTDEDIENLTESARNIVPNEVNKVEKKNDLHVEDVDPNTYPSLKSIAKVDDVIAFKIFKMGNDYTPQFSNYIIGKVLNVHEVTSLYTIKILRGQSEIEKPKGKFALPDDEVESPSDVIKLPQVQLLEARLIFST